jgi:hypothetical protein
MDGFMYDASDLNNATLKKSVTGGQDLWQNGKLIGTQKAGIMPGTTDTYINGKLVASTKLNPMNQIEIHQNGELTGTIAPDVTGKIAVYDQQHHKIAEINPKGNIQKIMTHPDPLSQADRIHLQQLKFYIGNSN